MRQREKPSPERENTRRSVKKSHLNARHSLIYSAICALRFGFLRATCCKISPSCRCVQYLYCDLREYREILV